MEKPCSIWSYRWGGGEAITPSPRMDLPLRNNNIPPITHHFQDMADYWSNCHCQQRCPSLMHMLRAHLQIQNCEIWPQETRNVRLSCGVKCILNWLDVTHKCDRWTERQMERHSDNIGHGSLCCRANNLRWLSLQFVLGWLGPLMNCILEPASSGFAVVLHKQASILSVRWVCCQVLALNYSLVTMFFHWLVLSWIESWNLPVVGLL